MSFSGLVSVVFAMNLAFFAQQEADTYTLEDALQICARVKDPTDRLACFEGLARSAAPDATQAQSAADAEPARDAPESAPPPQVAEETPPQSQTPAPAASSGDAGARYVIMRADEYEDEKRAIQKQPKPPREPYEATVLRAWEYANGDFYIALTNGEIWKNMARATPRRIEDGEIIRLRPGVVGGWFMQFTTKSRPTIKVKKVE